MSESIPPADKKQLAREFLDLEELQAREARSRAVVLEILGDIPDADVAPPKNVLFVCKLNPVTEADDLKLIFSRFGPVISCDVIRDYKTGDSLQYAFVEFETEDACNDAYFRMQNVLIDDRRIHVDFCQSVSGFWKRFKENGNFTRAKSAISRSSVTNNPPKSHGDKVSDQGSRHNHDYRKPRRSPSILRRKHSHDRHLDRHRHSHRHISTSGSSDASSSDDSCRRFRRRHRHRSRSRSRDHKHRRRSYHSSHRHDRSRSRSGDYRRRRHYRRSRD